MSSIITNPNGAFGYGPLTSYIGGLFTVQYVAETAVVQGNSLAWFDAVTSTNYPTVEPWDVSDANNLLFCGVALEAAAAGEVFNACRAGWCLALFTAADTPTFGEAVLIGTEDGKLASTAAAAGQSQLGVVLGVDDAANLAPIELWWGTARQTA